MEAPMTLKEMKEWIAILTPEQKDKYLLGQMCELVVEVSDETKSELTGHLEDSAKSYVEDIRSRDEDGPDE